MEDGLGRSGVGEGRLEDAFCTAGVPAPHQMS